MTPKTARLVLSLSLLAPPALTGCSSPGPTEVPAPAQRDLDDLRDRLVEGKREIQETCNTVRALGEKAGDVPEASISKLMRDINELETMRGEIAEGGQERREASIASFESLQEKGREVASVYDPFVAQLVECKRYLDTDNTPQGLAVVRPQLEGQLEKEQELQRMLDGLIAHIEVMRGAGRGCRSRRAPLQPTGRDAAARRLKGEVVDCAMGPASGEAGGEDGAWRVAARGRAGVRVVALRAGARGVQRGCARPWRVEADQYSGHSSRRRDFGRMRGPRASW